METKRGDVLVGSIMCARDRDRMGLPSAGVFLKEPNLYFRKVRRKPAVTTDENNLFSNCASTSFENRATQQIVSFIEIRHYIYTVFI